MKLYVGNLPYDLDGDGLKELFEGKGFAVEKAFVVEDRESGRSRGFGFVETPDGEKAISAFEGVDLGGRSLVVNEARPSPERGGGGQNRSNNRGGRSAERSGDRY